MNAMMVLEGAAGPSFNQTTKPPRTSAPPCHVRRVHLAAPGGQYGRRERSPSCCSSNKSPEARCKPIDIDGIRLLSFDKNCILYNPTLVRCWIRLC